MESFLKQYNKKSEYSNKHARIAFIIGVVIGALIMAIYDRYRYHDYKFLQNSQQKILEKNSIMQQEIDTLHAQISDLKDQRNQLRISHDEIVYQQIRKGILEYGRSLEEKFYDKENSFFSLSKKREGLRDKEISHLEEEYKDILGIQK